MECKDFFSQVADFCKERSKPQQPDEILMLAYVRYYVGPKVLKILKTMAMKKSHFCVLVLTNSFI
jgi:hypothetical protein